MLASIIFRWQLFHDTNFSCLRQEKLLALSGGEPRTFCVATWCLNHSAKLDCWLREENSRFIKVRSYIWMRTSKRAVGMGNCFYIIHSDIIGCTAAAAWEIFVVVCQFSASEHSRCSLFFYHAPSSNAQ